MPAHLLFPVAASIAYVFAMLAFKRSGNWGVGVWRTAFVSNIAIGLAFAPFWLLGGHDQPVTQLWQPLLVALLFLFGQIFTFLSLHYGDVSVGTPVMGLKIILVALGSALLLPDPIPLKWWIAAFLSTAAIILLSRGESRPRHAVGRTVLAAALAATSFALFDVLIQKWSPAWGVGRFLPLTCGAVAVLSFGFIPLFNAPLSAIPRPAWRWLGGGSLLLALQSSLFVYAIGAFGDATVMNIVYSSRGLWSVVAVWLIGHWFANEEQTLAPAILRSRLIGAMLILAAIALVVLR
ncbi:DMT family transporter [Rariglobus hedericola]|uniref:DMT family transporter n=1 Tax=Rariglobus hedericola TaxID=2597822 RepID=A0A556QRL6_9BACT|nr:DMT family transporter [Rariglobus hedericola]TSJ79284.1 DMT family transporter [Rariglobus hedericola]